MGAANNQKPSKSFAEVSEATSVTENSPLRTMLQAQPFWVLVAIIILSLAISLYSDVFLTERNIYNTTRNFAFFGIMALGMTAVILTAGIDLSVGSLMGLCGITVGLIMQAGYPVWLGFLGCMGVGLLSGLFTGYLVAYLRIAPFVVTLGMLAILRSLAMVLSNNKMIYEFGPDQDLYEWIGGSSVIGVPNPVWVLIILTIVFVLAFRFTRWGRYLFAIGGNRDAAKLSGIPVEKVEVSAYVVSALTAALATFLIVGWFGSVTNALGVTYELTVIASAVIGGANLMGGVAYAVGAPIGAALVELIRNSLLLAGVDALWQGFFVGMFIIIAVYVEKIRRR